MDTSSGWCGVGGFVVDEIERNLRKIVRVEDIQETDASLSDENIDEAEKSEELKPCKPQHSEKAAFSEKDDPELTQPNVLLVSAMKGTRNKMGSTPGKLTVKWAADVYDPVPNSLSHSVKSKQRKHRKDKGSSKYNKNGKKGHKSCSKGAASKDKKQHRKTDGGSEKVYKTLNTRDTYELLDKFDIGSPVYCGSSFLKKSQSNFHYSVTEAL